MKPSPSAARSPSLRPATLATHALALALLLTGCTGVYVSRPLGDRPHVLAPAGSEGTWICGDFAAKARVVDACQGRLKPIEAKFSDGQPKLDVTEIVITEAGNWLFATLLNPADPARDERVRRKRHGDQLVVWPPAQDAFRALVQAGKLPGRLEDEHGVLAPPVRRRPRRAQRRRSRRALRLGRPGHDPPPPPLSRHACRTIPGRSTSRHGRAASAASSRLSRAFGGPAR